MEISIHAPRVGCDLKRGGFVGLLCLFQSTHPVWGATDYRSPRKFKLGFQSTHPVWGATPSGRHSGHFSGYFNPRTPCGVRRPHRHQTSGTPSYFNPRTPCGVRPVAPLGAGDPGGISIHAPRVGCDILAASSNDSARTISIHAPRVGCDSGCKYCRPSHRYFNPRTPCGVRRENLILGALPPHYFNPRTPCGVRPRSSCHSWVEADFNPRTPCGVRRSVVIRD